MGINQASSTSIRNTFKTMQAIMSESFLICISEISLHKYPSVNTMTQYATMYVRTAFYTQFRFFFLDIIFQKMIIHHFYYLLMLILSFSLFQATRNFFFCKLKLYLINHFLFVSNLEQSFFIFELNQLKDDNQMISKI